MKQLFLYIIALTFVHFCAFAQSEGCVTPQPDSTWLDRQPYYGNNQYLFNLFDSLQTTRGGRHYTKEVLLPQMGD